MKLMCLQYEPIPTCFCVACSNKCWKTNLNVAVIDYITDIIVVVITAYRYFRFRLRF